MHIKIHTQGIKGSGFIQEGEEAGALFSALLEIDGQIYDRVKDINVNFGEEFATVNVTLTPANVEVVTHTKDSWQKVCEQADARDGVAEFRRKDGRTISIYVDPK